MKKNKDMFSNIIGYDNIKITLERIIDVLNNEEKYEKLGSTIPHGLLLYGEPGLGKSSLASDFLNNVDRKKYTIRKMKSDGDFIEYINEIFMQARDNQPSIILLDDLDKFAEHEEKMKNDEEFVAVQTLIDDVHDEDIFIIATVNDMDVLPESLLRSGRFDIKIKIDYPDEEDAYKIFKYYLSFKQVSNDINVKNISHILSASSCADLEKVCNQAGIYAGYKNKDKIEMEDLLRAALELKYNTSIEDNTIKDEYSLNTAYHEAGHALIGELLDPGSVSFITIKNTDSSTRGFTSFHNNKFHFEDVNHRINRIKALLGGKAATEIVYGKCDIGSKSDLRRASDIVNDLIDDYCMFGFDSLDPFGCAGNYTKDRKDMKRSGLLEKYYQEVKELLAKNRSVLDKLAHTLEEKKILFKDEIKEILSEV